MRGYQKLSVDERTREKAQCRHARGRQHELSKRGNTPRRPSLAGYQGKRASMVILPSRKRSCHHNQCSCIIFSSPILWVKVTVLFVILQIPLAPRTPRIAGVNKHMVHTDLFGRNAYPRNYHFLPSAASRCRYTCRMRTASCPHVGPVQTTYTNCKRKVF